MKKKLNYFKSLDKIATEIPVTEVMVRHVISIDGDASVKKVIDMMAKHSISGLVVNDKEGKPIGVVSEGDVIRTLHKNKDPAKVPVKDVLSRGFFSIRSNLSIGEASVVMKKEKISKLPVVDKGQIVGYITKSDLLEKLNEIYFQNRRLVWLIVPIMLQFIVIAMLLVAYINK